MQSVHADEKVQVDKRCAVVEGEGRLKVELSK
jgi:hypothetical protein